MYKQGGPWTPEDHLRSKTFDGGLASTMAEVIRGQRVRIMDMVSPYSCLDWGCGLGLYLHYLRSLFPGLLTTGVEPISMGDAWQGGIQVQADMGGYPIHLGQHQFVLCLEVMEHMPIDTHEQAFDNLVASVRPRGLLFFSGAIPGQTGDGHVACRPESEWINEIEKRGPTRLERETRDLRNGADLPWFRQNAMVFRA